jgi:regulator of cell morphogenesis and NO signaling
MKASAEMPVGRLVAERLGRARVFEELGIDYCCHGEASLGEVCARRSLDVGQVLAEIARSDFQDAGDEENRVRYDALPPGDLADHIEATHHAYLRLELPRLTELAKKVAADHGEHRPEMAELRTVLAGLRAELEAHLLKEERVLFPLIKQLEQANRLFPMHCGMVANPIRVMEHEHDDAGEALRRLRALTDDYRPPDDACNSVKALYAGLEALEADLHRHIHKENNILFPRAAAMEATLAGAGA